MDDVARSEREKYERMYSHDEYKAHPHSIEYAKMLLKNAEWSPGDTVLDIGAGPGYASMFLIEQGLKVTGIDIASNSLLPAHAGKFPMIVGPLWNLPELPSAKLGLCADVMEHIPSDRVDDVLGVISRMVTASCFFNISFRMDGFGRLIGETLHMTVKPKEWWEAKLESYWRSVIFTGGKPGDHGNFFVAVPRRI